MGEAGLALGALTSRLSFMLPQETLPLSGPQFTSMENHLSSSPSRYLSCRNTDVLVQRCMRAVRKAPSHGAVLVILTMARLFPDSPHIY